jgi:hypothetical protein
MAKKGSNPNRKAKYAAQYARTVANKKRKLIKHIKYNPKDQTAAHKLTT